MTTSTQQTKTRRWVLGFLAAMVAALTAILGLTTSSASGAGVAENRVGAISHTVEPLVGPPQHVSAGQGRDAAEISHRIVVATGVAANAVGKAPQVLRVGDVKLSAVPKGAVGRPTQTGKGLSTPFLAGRLSWMRASSACGSWIR